MRNGCKKLRNGFKIEKICCLGRIYGKLDRLQ